jgi:hypothetical protein
MEKEEGRAVRLRPFGTPPSVVPKGRTSDAPLITLINNTTELRAPDEPLLRRTTLELYYNVDAIWLIYQQLCAVRMVRTTSRGEFRALHLGRNL